MEEQSESDRDMSDDNDGEDDDDGHDDDDDDISDTDSEASDAEESVWDPLVEEAKELHGNDYDQLVQAFVNDGLDEDEAKSQAYHRRLLSVLKREARRLFLEKLKWIREFRQDPIHQKVMETKKRFREEDGFDGEEALEASVKKRKFLLNRIFDDDAGYHDNNDEGSYEGHY